MGSLKLNHPQRLLKRCCAPRAAQAGDGQYNTEQTRWTSPMSPTSCGGGVRHFLHRSLGCKDVPFGGPNGRWRSTKKSTTNLGTWWLIPVAFLTPMRYISRLNPLTTGVNILPHSHDPWVVRHQPYPLDFAVVSTVIFPQHHERCSSKSSHGGMVVWPPV